MKSQVALMIVLASTSIGFFYKMQKKCYKTFVRTKKSTTFALAIQK